MRTPSISSSSAPCGSAKRVCVSASAIITGSVLRHLTGLRRGELDRGLVEQAQLLVRGERAVADVIDAAREGVDGAHRPSALAREQADAVVEVRRGGARERFAAA